MSLSLDVGLHMSLIYNWWLSSNTYTVSQLRIQEMDKAPKPVILRGGEGREGEGREGEGSEIHPFQISGSITAVPSPR